MHTTNRSLIQAGRVAAITFSPPLASACMRSSLLPLLLRRIQR